MADSDTPVPSNAAWLELPNKSAFALTGDCHIGRTAGNEIVNPDNRISRRNSVLQREGNHYVLVDLGSTNGTFLNEHRIFKPTRLRDHDVIMVGSERYLFRQPSQPGDPVTDPAHSILYRTAVSVGKTSCWMMRASPVSATGPAVEAWVEETRSTLSKAGAGLKRLPDAVLFAHWRDGKADPARVRAAIQDLARRGGPARTRMTVHHGPVRVGPSTNAMEENLLGAAVTFTHQLAAVATRLDANVVLTDAAVQTLQFTESVRPLGEHAVLGAAGATALFTLKPE